MNCDFEYGFEYIGSASREVITPLTEKVFLSLAQGIQAFAGGLCMGPAVSIILVTMVTVISVSRCNEELMYNV